MCLTINVSAKFDAVYPTYDDITAERKINPKAWFAYTVTSTMCSMADFMKWKLTESGLDKFNPITGPRPIITHHMCHSPKYFNVKVLPELKEQVKDYYPTTQRLDFNNRL